MLTTLILLTSLSGIAGAGPSLRAVADTQTVSGVSMPTTIEVNGQALVLNGMGLRKKAIFKVYVAGLYLPQKTSDAEAILGADEPRRMVLQFLRGVNKDQMCGAWKDALKDNTPDASDQLKEQFATLCGYMGKIEKGEQLVFTYLPGHGTDVEIRGNLQGTIEGKEFADALFKAWIGPKPGPGQDFKKKVLGQD